MDSDTTQSRWDEIKQIWQEWKILYVIVGFIAGLLTFPALQLILADLNDFLSSLVPEAFGIAFTVFLIDRLYSQRDEKRRIWEHKQRLIRETGSTSNEIARNAIDELRSLDWLEGENGILRGTSLIAANLAGARLYEANFEGADLSSTLHILTLEFSLRESYLGDFSNLVVTRRYSKTPIAFDSFTSAKSMGEV